MVRRCSFANCTTGFLKHRTGSRVQSNGKAVRTRARTNKFKRKRAILAQRPFARLKHPSAHVRQLSSKNVRALCISGDQDAPLESSAASWSPEIRSDAYTAVEGRVTHLFGSPEAFYVKWRTSLRTLRSVYVLRRGACAPI